MNDRASGAKVDVIASSSSVALVSGFFDGITMQEPLSIEPR
jgi:hypothetical protein